MTTTTTTKTTTTITTTRHNNNKNNNNNNNKNKNNYNNNINNNKFWLTAVCVNSYPSGLVTGMMYQSNLSSIVEAWLSPLLYPDSSWGPYRERHVSVVENIGLDRM